MLDVLRPFCRRAWALTVKDRLAPFFLDLDFLDNEREDFK